MQLFLELPVNKGHVGLELLQQVSYLNRTRHFGSFDAKVDLTGYRHADEQPVIKAEVVDQPEYIRHRQVK